MFIAVTVVHEHAGHSLDRLGILACSVVCPRITRRSGKGAEYKRPSPSSELKMQRVDKKAKEYHGTMSPDKTHKVHKKKKKPTHRPRPLPPDVTARNLANEKKKRGEMNEKFLEMARLVPDLATARKLNRVLIVNETVSHLRHQRSICIAAAHNVRRLMNENHSLRTELDALRQMTGQFMSSNVQQMHTDFSDSLREFLSIETQPLGAFPDGLGGHYGDDAEKDESESPVSTTEQTAAEADCKSTQNSQFTPALWSDGGCVAWQDAALGQNIFNIPPAMECGDSIVPMPMDSFLHHKHFGLAIEPFLLAPFISALLSSLSCWLHCKLISITVIQQKCLLPYDATSLHYNLHSWAPELCHSLTFTTRLGA